MRRFPHRMSHTLEVEILKELRTQGLFSLSTTVRIIKTTVQEIQNTRGDGLMVIQAIRTPRGVSSDFLISRRGVQSHLGPVLRTEQSISSPLGIHLVPSPCFQAGTLIMKAGVVTGCAQIAIPAAVTMALGCMAARGFRLTPFARYGQPITEGIILGLFLGFPVLIPLEVSVQIMEVGVLRKPRRIGPPAHPVGDIIGLTYNFYTYTYAYTYNNFVPGEEIMPTVATTEGPSNRSEILLSQRLRGLVVRENSDFTP